jgi:hypothetical protein
MPYANIALLPHSRQAKNMGGWYMREISIYKLQIPNKLQKANYKYLVIEICDLPSKNIKMLIIYV